MKLMLWEMIFTKYKYTSIQIQVLKVHGGDKPNCGITFLSCFVRMMTFYDVDLDKSCFNKACYHSSHHLFKFCNILDFIGVILWCKEKLLNGKYKKSSQILVVFKLAIKSTLFDFHIINHVTYSYSNVFMLCLSIAVSPFSLHVGVVGSIFVE